MNAKRRLYLKSLICNAVAAAISTIFMLVIGADFGLIINLGILVFMTQVVTTILMAIEYRRGFCAHYHKRFHEEIYQANSSYRTCSKCKTTDPL